MGIMTISVAKAQQHIVTVTHQEIVTVTYTPGAETAAGGSGSGSGSGGWDGAAAGQEGGYYAGGGADGGDGNSWGSGSGAGAGAERVADQAVDGHYAEDAEDLDGKVNAHQTRTSTGDDLSSSKTASMSKTSKTSSSDEGNAAMNVKVPVAIVAIAMMAVIGGVAL